MSQPQLQNNGSDILTLVRNLGIENMWEERRNPNFVDALNASLHASKQSYPPGCYVGSGGRCGNCDVVFDNNWIEVKFAWTYRDQDHDDYPNKNFLKHLFNPDESALKDLRDKLPTLIGRPEIRSLGFLLVYFDSDLLPFNLSLIDELESKASLGDAWTRQELPPWRNPNNPRCRIRAFFWHRVAR